MEHLERTRQAAAPPDWTAVAVAFRLPIGGGTAGELDRAKADDEPAPAADLG